MNNIPEYTLPFIEDLINRVLRLDRDTLDRLGDMDGKIICCQYQRQGEALHTIYMLPFAGGLRLRMKSDSDVEADVTISGNLPVFTGLLFGEASASKMAKAELQIRGDIKLGQQFREITDKLDLDLTGHVAEFIGDGPAHRLGLMAQDWMTWKSNVGKTFSRDFAEFIQEERRLSPRQEEVDGLLDGIEELQSDVDRLASRLMNLKEKFVS